MKPPRGGRTPIYAHLRTSGGWTGEKEAWVFHGEPENPHTYGSAKYFEWEQHERALALTEFSQEGLEKRLGHCVPELVWNEARETVYWFVANMQPYDSPHANNDKNDPDSFGATKKKWSSQLDRMFKEMDAMLEDEMSYDIWKRYRQDFELHSTPKNRLRSNLESALEVIGDTIAIVGRAKPLQIKLPHQATIRREAGRRLKTTANKFELPAKEFVKAFNIYVGPPSDYGFSEWFQSLNETD